MREISFTKEEVPAKLKLAMEYIRDNKNLEEAELICNAVLNQSPDHAPSYGILGVLYGKKNFNTLAEHFLKHAISLEKDRTNLSTYHNNLGYHYKTQLYDTDKALIEFEKALKYNDKNEIEQIINYASIFVSAGQPEVALKHIDKALLVDKDNADAHWNKALVLLEMGRYKEGFQEYNHKYRDKSKYHRNYGFPEWDGSPGKRIIVYGEQAIGDEILFASMLPDLIKMSNLVIFDSHPRLCDIFRRSFPEIPVYGTRKCQQIQWITNHQPIDAQISIGSLLEYLRTDGTNFPGTPYLKADPKLVELYKQKLSALGDKPKIGISWKGGTPGTGLKYRKFDLELYKPIFEAFDADYISLQYTENAALSVKAFEEKHPGFKVHHWQQAVDDYDHTAALVSQLDLVISVPQSVVFLAGALGTPVFQVTPKRILWQSGVYGHETLPWYNSVKLFWQNDDEKWPPVIEKVKEALCRLSPTNTEN